VKTNQTAVPRERTGFHIWRMEPVMREEIALTVFGIFHLQLKVCNLLDYANQRMRTGT
jgi:hypothetical protein